MEFGVLFTSHPNPKEEPYPHRDVHARTTEEVLEAERLGYDYPPYYGCAKTMQSLKLFAERVIPAFRPPVRRAVAAE